VSLSPSTPLSLIISLYPFLSIYLFLTLSHPATFPSLSLSLFPSLSIPYSLLIDTNRTPRSTIALTRIFSSLWPEELQGSSDPLSESYIPTVTLDCNPLFFLSEDRCSRLCEFQQLSATLSDSRDPRY
jgi:hypothetical protein